MRTVYLITTGGTIEKMYSEQSSTVVNRVGEIERYLKLLRLLGPDVFVVIHSQVFPIDCVRKNKDVSTFEVG